MEHDDPNDPYWNARAEHDRAKLREIWEICDIVDAHNTSDAETWVLITSDQLHAIIARPMT